MRVRAKKYGVELDGEEVFLSFKVELGRLHDLMTASVGDLIIKSPRLHEM